MNQTDDCKREDLRIITNTFTCWGVNDDGAMSRDDFAQGEVEKTFDSYLCHNCGYEFDLILDDERMDAWKSALSHVTGSATQAVTGVGR